ncbi:MAG: hypothetical protein OEM59_14580 [Rhodospirillales bacterium]|nr:hypothetical protein [Rhodospirillales bacterium]
MNKKTEVALSVEADFLPPHIPIIERANWLARHDKDGDVGEHALVGQQIKQLIDLASKHVSTERGRLALDEQALFRHDIAASDIGSLRKSIEIANKYIANKSLVLTSGTKLRSNSAFFWQGLVMDPRDWRAWFDVHWWGVEVCMNHELTQALSLQLLAGAGAAALLVILEGAGLITAPAAIPTAIVGLILVAGATRLQVNDHGNGVCIYLPFYPPGVNWISPR